MTLSVNKKPRYFDGGFYAAKEKLQRMNNVLVQHQIVFHHQWMNAVSEVRQIG